MCSSASPSSPLCHLEPRSRGGPRPATVDLPPSLPRACSLSPSFSTEPTHAAARRSRAESARAAARRRVRQPPRHLRVDESPASALLLEVRLKLELGPYLWRTQGPCGGVAVPPASAGSETANSGCGSAVGRGRRISRA
jgi:hypothetical protein